MVLTQASARRLALSGTSIGRLKAQGLTEAEGQQIQSELRKLAPNQRRRLRASRAGDVRSLRREKIERIEQKQILKSKLLPRAIKLAEVVKIRKVEAKVERIRKIAEKTEARKAEKIRKEIKRIEEKKVFLGPKLSKRFIGPRQQRKKPSRIQISLSQSLQDKARTGQSLSPSELKQLQIENKKPRGFTFKALTSDQKSFIDGETVVTTTGGISFLIGKDGKVINRLTGGEKINLNPAQFVIAPTISGIKILDFIFRNKNKTATIIRSAGELKKAGALGVVVGLLNAAITNPFGFAGESVAAGGAFKLGSKLVRITNTGIRKIKIFEENQIPKLKKQIKVLESQKVKSRLDLNNLQVLKEQLKIFEKDLRVFTAPLDDIRISLLKDKQSFSRASNKEKKIIDSRIKSNIKKADSLIRRRDKSIVENKKIIEKVKVEVLSKKEALAIEKRFKKKQSTELIKSLPRTELSLLNFVNRLPLLNKSQLRLVKTKLQKVGARFQLTTVQTRNKGLFKLTFDKPTQLIIKKGLPSTDEAIIKLLLIARKDSGIAFSNLKKKIKKELGLNVVERKIKGRVSFKLLQPKEQRKKGTKTKKVRETVFIIRDKKVIGVSKVRKGLVKEVKQTETRIISEFEKGQNLEKVLNDFKRIAKEQESKGFFKNKKAQGSLLNVIRRFNSRKNNKSKNLNKESSKVKGTFKKEVKRSREINKDVNKNKDRLNKESNKAKGFDRNLIRALASLKRIRAKRKELAKKGKVTKSVIKEDNDIVQEIKTLTKQSNNQKKKIAQKVINTKKLIKANKNINTLKKAKIELSKSKTKMVQQIKQELKTNQSLISILVLISKLTPKSKKEIGVLQKQTNNNIQALKESLDNLQESKIEQIQIPDFDFPTPQPPTPSFKGDGFPPPPIRKFIDRRPPPPPPPKPPKIKIGKPPKPPKKIPAKPPRLRTSPKKKKGFRQAYNIRFRQKGKPITVTLNLPLNKALLRAANLVDTTTARSLDVVKGGFTKDKDIKRPSLIDKKFRVRRTKTALRLVERRKFAIDSAGEKRGLTLAKKLKRRKKKTLRKRLKKKFIKRKKK